MRRPVKELWRSAAHPKLVFGVSYARSGNAGNLFLWQDKAFFNAKGTVCLSLTDGKEIGVSRGSATRAGLATQPACV